MGCMADYLNEDLKKMNKHKPKFPDDYLEIKQGEYKKLKKSDPKNVNGYTARILFKYYKCQKPKVSEHLANQRFAQLKKDVGYISRINYRGFSFSI